MKIDTDKLWTTTAYAKEKGIPIRTVQYWCEKDKIPNVKIGGHGQSKDVVLIIEKDNHSK